MVVNFSNEKVKTKDCCELKAQIIFASYRGLGLSLLVVPKGQNKKKLLSFFLYPLG
jgi:hypothetical protein